MRWNLTVFFLALFACVSYGLYQLSYEVQQLEDDLAGLRRGIENNHEAVKVLEAEWAYQNRPDVLQALAARHLPLLLIAPYQVAALDDIPVRGAGGGAPEMRVPVPRSRPGRGLRDRQAPPGSLHLASFSHGTERDEGVQ